MKSFKKFLVEEMASDKVTADATPTTPQSSVTPPAPSMFAPDSVKQQYANTVAKTQINKAGGDDEYIHPDDVPPPPKPIAPEEWNQNNPMPRQQDYDQNGDGVLDDDENRLYITDLERWRRAYERYMREWDDYHRGISPEWNTPEYFYRENDNPKDPLRKEEYEYWLREWRRIHGDDQWMRDLFEWWWRTRRPSGNQGKPWGDWFRDENEPPGRQWKRHYRRDWNANQ